jgi:glutathione S-transferase
MLRLYHVPLCPYSRKVRMALREKNLTCELIETAPWERSDEFLALNPAGEAPVLVDDDLVVCDSQAIGDYLDEAFPQTTLYGTSLEQRNETRRLVAWFDSKFAREVTDPLWREKIVKRWARRGFPRSDGIREAIQNVRFHLAYIDWLFQDRRWLAGDELTMADLAGAAHLSVLDYMGDINWEGAGSARDWYAKMKSRPSMRPILLERVRGLNPPDHYDDPDF